MTWIAGLSCEKFGWLAGCGGNRTLFRKSKPKVLVRDNDLAAILKFNFFRKTKPKFFAIITWLPFLIRALFRKSTPKFSEFITWSPFLNRTLFRKSKSKVRDK